MFACQRSVRGRQWPCLSVVAFDWSSHIPWALVVSRAAVPAWGGMYGTSMASMIANQRYRTPLEAGSCPCQCRFLSLFVQMSKV